MTVNRPYKRTYRPSKEGGTRYMQHSAYAKNPQHSIRALEIIQNDLKIIFEYVEPSDANGDCYSFRIHSLYMRVCMEIESNFKLILSENGYERDGNWNIGDYKKLQKTHHLSEYEIEIPIWDGNNKTRTPFAAWKNAAWKNNAPLPWYQAYNKSKHERQTEFKAANLNNMMDAICGLVAVLSSQFHTYDFSLSSEIASHTSYLAIKTYKSEFLPALGDYFHVKFPDDWCEEDRYDFRWEEIKAGSDPFRKLRSKWDTM